MLKVTLTRCIALSLTALLFSCGKDKSDKNDDNPNSDDSTPTSSVVKGEIKGSKWEANTARVYFTDYKGSQMISVRLAPFELEDPCGAPEKLEDHWTVYARVPKKLGRVEQNHENWDKLGVLMNLDHHKYSEGSANVSILMGSGYTSITTISDTEVEGAMEITYDDPDSPTRVAGQFTAKVCGSY
jgi:hypothetical protein